MVEKTTRWKHPTEQEQNEEEFRLRIKPESCPTCHGVGLYERNGITDKHRLIQEPPSAFAEPPEFLIHASPTPLELSRKSTYTSSTWHTSTFSRYCDCPVGRQMEEEQIERNRAMTARIDIK